MDIKTTFLNGVVEEEVYKENPLGFEAGIEDVVRQDGQLPDELRLYQE